ncbi:unnamed protein product [Linum trigynum]|uniref:Uncharacterized protein n=1 Tax=Linum trigynum TaxID=586398 RepID=A0AAV2FVY8_9ROSI
MRITPANSGGDSASGTTPDSKTSPLVFISVYCSSHQLLAFWHSLQYLLSNMKWRGVRGRKSCSLPHSSPAVTTRPRTAAGSCSLPSTWHSPARRSPPDSTKMPSRPQSCAMKWPPTNSTRLPSVACRRFMQTATPC